MVSRGFIGHRLLRTCRGRPAVTAMIPIAIERSREPPRGSTRHAASKRCIRSVICSTLVVETRFMSDPSWSPWSSVGAILFPTQLSRQLLRKLGSHVGFRCAGVPAARGDGSPRPARRRVTRSTSPVPIPTTCSYGAATTAATAIAALFSPTPPAGNTTDPARVASQGRLGASRLQTESHP